VYSAVCDQFRAGSAGFFLN